MDGKVCRNCGSSERYTQEVNANGGHGPSLLPLGWLGWTNTPKFIIEVCGNCGLVDWFVAPRFLDKVKEKFVRAT